MSSTAFKNKDQVRFFYYRTWQKIGKYVSFNQGKRHTENWYNSNFYIFNGWV